MTILQLKAIIYKKKIQFIFAPKSTFNFFFIIFQLSKFSNLHH